MLFCNVISFRLGPFYFFFFTETYIWQQFSLKYHLAKIDMYLVNGFHQYLPRTPEFMLPAHPESTSTSKSYRKTSFTFFFILCFSLYTIFSESAIQSNAFQTSLAHCLDRFLCVFESARGMTNQIAFFLSFFSLIASSDARILKKKITFFF